MRLRREDDLPPMTVMRAAFGALAVSGRSWKSTSFDAPFASSKDTSVGTDAYPSGTVSETVPRCASAFAVTVIETGRGFRSVKSINPVSAFTVTVGMISIGR